GDGGQGRGTGALAVRVYLRLPHSLHRRPAGGRTPRREFERREAPSQSSGSPPASSGPSSTAGRNAAICFSDGARHRHTAPCGSPAARASPDGEKATELTHRAGCGSTRSDRPVSTCHRRTLRSSPVVASVLPSGENATELIRCVCSRNDQRFSPVANSQTVT